MRIAFIACSSYSQCQKLTELSSAEADVDLLGQRLSEPDAGFVVHSFRAERGLAEAVDQVLAETREPVDELLFYFSGYAVLNDERGPALLLDGERLSAFSLKRLRRVLAERARSSLAVIDTVPAFDGHTSPEDAVKTVASALVDESSGVHLLAASRPESLAFGRSPFASLFELVLDWQSVSGSPVRVDSLYTAMRAEEALFAQVPAAAYYPGAQPFELLRPTAIPPWSDPPPSVVPPSVVKPATPSVEPSIPRADPLPEFGGERSLEAEARPPLVSEMRDARARLEPPDPDEATPVQTAPVEAAPVEAAPVEPTPVEPTPVEPTPLHKSVPPPLPKRKPTLAPPPPAVDVPTAPATPEAARAIALERLTECLADGRHADALGHARTALRLASRDVETYRTLHLLFEKLGRPDGSWNVACVLEALGAADVNESLLAGLHRPEGLIAAKNILDDYEWKKRQLYPERDPALDALFYALGNASVEVGAETAQRKRRMVSFDPATEQDPSKSTTTLARTLVWSARLLGLPTPKLYVVDGTGGDLTPAPTVEPIVLASKALGSGLGLPELAFLWARRLVLFRPEHRIVTFLTNAAELEEFVRAAQVLGGGNERSFKRLEGDTKLFARGLKRHLRGIDRAPLEAVANSIVREAIPSLVFAYRRSIELASARAGLLACGELALALRMTERFPQHGALTLDEQNADLLVYSVSDEYAALRERLGVALRG
ncbi:MAG TPA: hypothetical protein VMS65_17165 [Polyangiaceae bacterium]|nr:hypothetical protein [Polyangiaceae bacterium]